MISTVVGLRVAVGFPSVRVVNEDWKNHILQVFTRAD